jgi:methylmalonyl-CoA mutase N-terminal domain/subunit
MAEAGATPAQEIAFTLADGIAYVQAAIDAGLQVDDFAPRLSFFFVARTTILEEVAKFRAARRVWAKIMKERFGAQKPKSQMLRFHTQTAGSALQAQQPEINIVRVAIEALAAALGGTQSLHTNSFDEAIALPTTKSARIALRTQQIIAFESDVCKVVDPLAGAYAIESLTDELEAEIWKLINKIDELGGSVKAIEKGFQKAEIADSAYRYSQSVDSGERIVVGVNKFTIDETEAYDPLVVDPTIGEQQTARIAELKARRDNAAVEAALAKIKEVAQGTDNLLYPMKDALKLGATEGEVCDVLRAVWGKFQADASI